MSRSVYSLLLSDDVIRAVDRAAYSMNTSRSNLINQILAEYVSYTTPEKRMRDIFDSLTTLISSNEPFLVQSQGSDALLNIRSPLQVKYNPTIKYTVELSRDSENNVGELRIMTRTQSAALLDQLEGFFLLFCTIESAYFKASGLTPPQYQIVRGKFLRKFAFVDPKLDSDAIGQAIAQYIQCIDRSINSYLNASATHKQAAIEESYRAYLNSHPIVL